MTIAWKGNGMTDSPAPSVFDNDDPFGELPTYSSEPPQPPVQKKKRIPLTDGHKRLRVIATFLVIALVAVVALGAALVTDYKQQNKALTQCYATAEAQYWTLIAVSYANTGEDNAAMFARSKAEQALAPLKARGDLDVAMESCKAQFYNDGLMRR
jgi:uncharacterized protein HemX